MAENARSAHEVCADLGIEIIRPGRRTAADVLQTCAERRIEKMLIEHGEGHVIFTLRTIAETEGNSGELVAFTIEAVSRLVRDHPRWTDLGTKWLEAFDKIDLPAIRNLCRQNRAIVPMADGITTLVFDRLLDLLGDPSPPGKCKGRGKPRGRRKIPATVEAASMAL